MFGTWMIADLSRIIKIYPPIKNPGPNSNSNFKNELTVYYQNVQALIPFGQLGKEHPVFNDAKLMNSAILLNHVLLI